MTVEPYEVFVVDVLSPGGCWAGDVQHELETAAESFASAVATAGMVARITKRVTYQFAMHVPDPVRAALAKEPGQ